MLHFARWKSVLIWLIVAIGILFAFPNVLTQRQLDSLPGFLPDRPMTLGLDLQGGSYLLLEIDRQSLIDDRLEGMREEVRLALRNADIAYSGLGDSGSTVAFRLRDPAQADAVREALRPLTDAVASGLLTGGTISEAELAEPQPGSFQLSLTDAGVDYRLSTAVAQSIEVVRRRIDELGTTEPVIQRQGLDRIMVQVPGLQDPDRLRNLLNQTAQLTFRLVDVEASADAVASGQERAPAGTELLYTAAEPSYPILVQRQVMVSGENLTDAQPGFSQTNEPVVNIRFDSRGAQRFGAVTQSNVGRPFAIVLDEQVISAPNINEPILGGQAQISGSFTTQTANDLAVLLRAGALPATLNIIEERTVGPGLGADSIAAGQLASLIGGLLVVGFMFVCYGFTLGLLANIALAANVVILVAVLSFLGATLTLPGIAGIVLTMGMAVDSNVLIYERIRDERRAGRTMIQAVDAGISKASGTIMDSNITLLIAAAALFFLGTGPVRGFSVTLGLGVFSTIFSGLTLTRWLVAFWVRRVRPKEMPRGLLTLVPKNIHGNFMRVRNWAFAITAALSIAALASLPIVGVNYGIDFTGGTVIEVRSNAGEADLSELRQTVGDIVPGEVQVQSFGAEGDALIRFGSETPEGGNVQSMVEEVRGALAADYEIQRIEVVGPAVSSELAIAAAFGVLAALAGIMLYVWLRFEWQFAVGAIAATSHDVIMMIGFLVLTQSEFSLSSIAAILTVVGYSLNDTVVVFDRIRENLRRFKKMPIVDVIDLSLDETAPRTIIVTLSMVLALLALFLFGGEVVRAFVAPMLVGVLAGIYSSIYIAAPLTIFFKLRPENAKGEVIEEEPSGPGGVRATRAG